MGLPILGPFSISKVLSEASSSFSHPYQVTKLAEDKLCKAGTYLGIDGTKRILKARESDLSAEACGVAKVYVVDSG